MSENPILKIIPLDFQWPTLDPFLFCVHHDDAYPEGNGEAGPAATLAGRNIGQDFEPKDGWRMYHGDKVPGFPVHPHRGFETVTIVQRGLVDHADSLGAAGRYGRGDTQWMTAGRGVQHSEMFPLLQEDSPNPLELFQIWLNLPARSKMVEPYFSMLWGKDIPRARFTDEAGREIEVEVIAGALGDVTPLPTPPDSWAADPEHHVAIWIVNMAPGARWALPATATAVHRMMYYFDGDTMLVAGQELRSANGCVLQADSDVVLENGEAPSRLLLLQGKPISEPVVQYGPFVMNSRAEIQQAFRDFSETGFGGWPWPRADQVHAPDKDRFARHADGHEETPAS